MTRLTAKSSLFRIEETPLREATRLVGVIVIADSENDDKTAIANIAAIEESQILDQSWVPNPADWHPKYSTTLIQRM